MKLLLIAAAFAVLPAAAQAQVAAGAVPDPFAREGQAAEAEAAAPAAREPLNAAAEPTLRTIIASAQAGAMDYSVMTEDLASKVREQEAQVTPLIQGFGDLQSVEFVGSQNGADLFAVTFAEAATQWIIGFNEAGKVAALLFRPAE
ncbi:MAG: hypothetical protein A2623_05990 [Caulobacterales bacterium RIFCSPHIGHO2_01_FULL_70_19]|nr:MAG: hypothetical protein A2623_05990 [Caulobacterales bacterium RIFCSPHIGHO2_01_FULL_70_19]